MLTQKVGLIKQFQHTTFGWAYMVLERTSQINYNQSERIHEEGVHGIYKLPSLFIFLILFPPVFKVCVSSSYSSIYTRGEDNLQCLHSNNGETHTRNSETTDLLSLWLVGWLMFRGNVILQQKATKTGTADNISVDRIALKNENKWSTVTREKIIVVITLVRVEMKRQLTEGKSVQIEWMNNYYYWGACCSKGKGVPFKKQEKHIIQQYICAVLPF